MKREDIAYFLVDNINLSSEELALRLINDVNPNITVIGRQNLIETIKKYKDTRTGLETIANNICCILGLFDLDDCDDPVGDCKTKHKIDIDNFVFLQNKGFTDPETMVEIIEAMRKANITVDINLVDESINAMCDYCVKYMGKLYTLETEFNLNEMATDSLADYYYSSAYTIARDEVEAMDNITLAENAGYYTVDDVIEISNGMLIVENE